MRDSNAYKAKRIAAGIIGLMLFVIILFPAFYIAAETDHQCTGKDCPICVCIRQCENTLHQIGSNTGSKIAAIVPVIFFFLTAGYSASGLLHETPVMKKDRLNN